MLASVLNRARYLVIGVIVAASLAASCLLGVRSDPPPTSSSGFCPPRWAADDDPDGPTADERRLPLISDVPGEATVLLPDRAVRIAPGCRLSLPIRVRAGMCYLFAAQIVPRAGRPRGTIFYPDPELDTAREGVIDHSMPTTFGVGADPICFDQDFEATIEATTENRDALLWVQAWELSPDASREWATVRRARLAEAARRAAEERERENAMRAERCISVDAGLDADVETDAEAPPCVPVFDTGGGSNDAGINGTSTDAGPIDAGSGDAAPECVDGGDAGPCVATATPEPEPEPEPESMDFVPLTEGPLAIELSEQCQDGVDNDDDGFGDCDDPDCLEVCRRFRNDRAPWMRIIDVRIGIAYRFSQLGFTASGHLDTTHNELESQWGLSTHASALWRPNRYLGLGLDFGYGFQSSTAMNSGVGGGEDSELRVSTSSISLGLALQVSFPIWIMEVGGSLGIGWLRTMARAEINNLNFGGWEDFPSGDRDLNDPYGSGWLWADFWITDGFALGLYGGFLVSLRERVELPINDFHVGLRSTLRVGF